MATPQDLTTGIDESMKQINLKYFLQLFVAFGLTSQCLLTTLYAQDNSEKITQQFHQYHTKGLHEKIFVHANKTHFIAGETLYFKIYSIDGMQHRPLDLSKVCYVELLDGSGNPAVQLKVSLKNGFGNGSLILPDSLNTGVYRLVSYTSWMRNFSTDYFFTRDITVLNPLESTAPSSAKQTQPTIRFFPEGGNLVAGLNSRVAFQVLGPDGKGISCKGALLNETGDTLLFFTPSKFGIGSFYFTPQKGRSYKAFIRTDAASFNHELPSTSDTGISIHLLHGQDSGKVTVNVQSNNIPVTGKEFSLLVHSRHRLRNSLKLVLDENGLATAEIAVNDFDDGISHFTLFDDKSRPQAERLFFKQPVRLMIIGTEQAHSSYRKRSPVALSVTTKNSGRNATSANLSLSVFRSDELQSFDSIDIVNYLLLTSDLKGKIENPAHYFRKSKEVASDIDHLMLTHGWRRFNWSDVLSRTQPDIKFPPEHEGHRIKVNLTNDHGTGVSNAFVFLSVPSKRIQFYAAKSNENGAAEFYTRDLHGNNELVIQKLGQTTSGLTFNLINSFNESYPPILSASLNVDVAYDELVRSYSIHRQVADAFNAKKNVSILTDTVAVFGHADKTYFLRDYVKFPSLKDVLREYVPEVIVRKRDKKSYLFVLDKESQVYFENEPLILLDGVPVFETDRITEIPAQNIEKVDVVTEKFFMGMFAFNGVVSIRTHNGLQTGTKLNPDAVVVDFNGLHIPREFYVPVYEGANAAGDRMPDFRNVLIWEDDLVTDMNGKTSVTFPTSDLPGKYIGVIQGISPDGEPGSATFSFKVGEPE
jgi:hypothetical protein